MNHHGHSGGAGGRPSHGGPGGGFPPVQRGRQSHSGKQDHLDPDVLAEFRAELITGRRARSISAHLAGCADCAALDERLAQVSALLTAVPVPAVPDALARRLDRVLAAEAQEVFSSERASVQSPSPRRPPSRLGEFLGRVFQVRVLAPAAGVLAVLAGAGFGLSQVSSSSSSMTASAGGNATGVGTGAAGAAASASSPAASSAPRAMPTAGGDSMTPDRRAQQAATGDAVDVVQSGTNYQHATLREQLIGQVAVRASLKASPAVPSVRECVLGLSGHQPRVLVESAYYNGAPATVVVVSTAHGDFAWVAGSQCSSGNRDILDSTVLSPGISTP